VNSDLNLGKWLEVLGEEHEDPHAEAAADLYMMLSRGLHVLPQGFNLAPQCVDNYRSALDAAVDVSAELQRLRSKGYLITLEEARRRFPSLRGMDRPTTINAMGCVLKFSAGKRKVRITLDASAPRGGKRSLNENIEPPPTRLASVRQAMAAIDQLAATSRHVYGYKLDVCDAFLQLACAEESIQYLGVEWLGEVLVYVRTPFGLSHVPSKFQTVSCAITRAVLRRCAKRGIVTGPAPTYDHLQPWASLSDRSSSHSVGCATATKRQRLSPPAPSARSSLQPAGSASATKPRRLSPPELHMMQYLDDFAGWASSWSVAETGYLVTQILCRELGVPLQDNPLKTTPPSQHLEFLGVEFTLTDGNMFVSLSLERVAKMLDTLDTIDLSAEIKVKELQSILGVLVFAACVIPAAKPYMRRMFNELRSCGPRPASNRRATVTTDIRHDIACWRTMLELLNGSAICGTISSPYIGVELFTDASLGGWGVYFGGCVLMGAWPAHWRSRMAQAGSWEVDIDFLEAVALLYGLRMVLPYCAGRGRLTCRIDNQAVCGMLHNLSSRSATALPVMKEITLLLTVYGVEAIPVWIASADNEAADALSRDHLGYDWRGIIARWNESQPDATRWHHLPPVRPDLMPLLHQERYRDPFLALAEPSAAHETSSLQTGAEAGARRQYLRR